MCWDCDAKKCKSCKGTKDSCTSCDTQQGLVLYESTCIVLDETGCPGEQFLLGEEECVEACPVGVYADVRTRGCEGCAVQCLDCDHGPLNCTKCFTPEEYLASVDIEDGIDIGDGTNCYDHHPLANWYFKSQISS